MIIKTKNITAKQAIKFARQQFREEHGKRSYNAMVSVMQRHGGGRYVLVISNGLSTEFYFD